MKIYHNKDDKLLFYLGYLMLFDLIKIKLNQNKIFYYNQNKYLLLELIIKNLIKYNYL